jgi:hypothetical protein
MMIDEHVMETFGPLDEYDMADAVQDSYNEGHYYATLRDFEELIAEHGVHRVFSDMDDDIVDMMERHAMSLNADKR